MDPKEIANLRPSDRHRLIARLAQSPKKLRGPPDGFQPLDHGHYLIHSLDLKLIVPALSHPYPQTRCLAIKALAKAWLQLPPNDTLDALGGASGLADILNTVTFSDAKSIAEKLGNHYRGPEDPRTACLDALVALMVPSIAAPGSAYHPVCRLGSTLATRFLPAVSPAIVSQLFKFVRAKDINRLRRLLHTQPAYVGNFLQSDYYEYDNSALQWPIHDLLQLFALPTVRSVPSEKRDHWGVTLFIKLISAPPAPPWLNFRPNTTEMVMMGAVALSNAPSEDVWNTVMQAFLDKLKLERDAGKMAGFYVWKKIILSITGRMSRFAQSNEDNSRLKSYLKRIGELASGLDAGITLLLPQLTHPIRQSLLRSLHGLEDGREWKFPDDAHRVGVTTVMHLKSELGLPILRQMEPHFNDMSFFAVRGNELPVPLMNIANDLRSRPVERDDAISVAIQGRWAFLEGDLGQQKETEEALERWKRLLHRQKQADDRLRYTRVLLTIVAAVGDPRLFRVTFAWVFDRFFKVTLCPILHEKTANRLADQDVDVRPNIFQNYMSFCVSILAGRADNLEESARDGDETIGLLIDTMSKARTEPNFQESEFNQTTTLCRKVLWERVLLCQKHLIPDSKTEAAIAPLKDLLLRVESIQLEDPGTFGEPELYPHRYQDGWYSFTIDLFPLYRRTYRRVLVKFMDDLSHARHALYADKRSAMEFELDDQKDSYDVRDPWSISHTRHAWSTSRTRDAWPYEVMANTFKGLSLEKDAPFLYEYLRKVSARTLRFRIFNVPQIVYTPVDKYRGTEQDAYRDQWPYAMCVKFYPPIAYQPHL